ncbi:MAG: DUF3291 domain-containing protein [Bacteroidota bacterium]
MKSAPVITVTFFRFEGIKNKFWAFTMMRLAHKHMKNIKGLKFYRLMGTGRGLGFDWKADFSSYAFLAAWENENQAHKFIADSAFFQKYQSRAKELFTVFMQPMRAHGQWDGETPFHPVGDAAGKMIGVITRATIKNRHLVRFWRNVPHASHSLKNSKGLLFAKGIGEWPFKYMATFSLWEDEASMQSYAYQSEGHRKVINKTRKLNWFKEDLFARFRPYKFEGTWKGKALST